MESTIYKWKAGKLESWKVEPRTTWIKLNEFESNNLLSLQTPEQLP